MFAACLGNKRSPLDPPDFCGAFCKVDRLQCILTQKSHFHHCDGRCAACCGATTLPYLKVTVQEAGGTGRDHNALAVAVPAEVGVWAGVAAAAAGAAAPAFWPKAGAACKNRSPLCKRDNAKQKPAKRETGQVQRLKARLAFAGCSFRERKVDWHAGFLGKLRIAMKQKLL
jgi:hypothetical protein